MLCLSGEKKALSCYASLSWVVCPSACDSLMTTWWEVNIVDFNSLCSLSLGWRFSVLSLSTTVLTENLEHFGPCYREERWTESPLLWFSLTRSSCPEGKMGSFCHSVEVENDHVTLSPSWLVTSLTQRQPYDLVA